MTATVPRLNPLPLGRSVRLIGYVVPGLRRVTAQIGPYTAWWDEQNQQAVEAEGPLLMALGDSTVIGIGASSPELGFVGRLRRRLEVHDGRPWRMINIGLSGARIQDGLDRQLPILDDLLENGVTPEALVCCIGANDVVWDKGDGPLRRRLLGLCAGLPTSSVIATTPGRSARARLANRTIRQGAAEHDLVALDPWNEPGPPPLGRMASDRFHPNDVGYDLVAQAFARSLGADDDREVPGYDPARQ
ncbi:MAG: SGNH/GDSL hydrolase family protein [Actinomycetota bacterium]